MKYLVCYDIQENRIRNKVAKLLESHAIRIQYSVFLGDFTENEAKALRQELLAITENSEERTLMMTPICANCSARMWQVGKYKEETRCCIVA